MKKRLSTKEIFIELLTYLIIPFVPIIVLGFFIVAFFSFKWI